MDPTTKAFTDIESYFINLGEIILNTTVSQGFLETTPGRLDSLNNGVRCVIDNLKNVLISRKRLMAIGNGGSAAIAIHTLADYANAGGIKTIDLMSPALLTCMGNDYGYENVFAKPVEIFAEKGDVLFAISSSGKSPNIIKACQAACEKGATVYTFSGFEPDNPLRGLGYLNFYVPSTHYGFVELSHQVLLHCILDLFVREKIK